MDIASLLIGIGLLAVFLVPVFLIQGANKRKAARKLADLKKQSQNYGINISKYEIWNDQFIGVDTSRRKVFLQRDIQNNSSGLVIGLDDFKSCKLTTEVKGGKNNSHDSQGIERIYLVLISRTQKSSDIKINFFDNDVNMAIRDELEIAKRWETNINNAMRPAS